MANEFCKNYETIFWVGTLMVCAMIVAIGLFKKAFLNKAIKNDSVRDAILSALNIFASYSIVAVTFWVKNINFGYYWFAATTYCIYSIFVYWLYKHTKAKDGIQKLGEFVLKKFSIIVGNKVNSIINAVMATKTVTYELTKPTDVSLKKGNPKKDDELDALK
jgi:hypothetical protein